MTDNEIIKALKCCTGYDCENCEALKYCDYMQPGALAGAALDLINRQKAEIERLQKNIDGLNIFTKNHIKVIRLQAIKEFAERLENNLCGCDVTGDRDNVGYITSDVHRIIYNLVKEMTEVNENEMPDMRK